MGTRRPYKGDVIGTQAAPVSKAAGLTAFSAVVPTNGADSLAGTVYCTKAHTVRVWVGNTAAAPADSTTMHLLSTVTGKAASGSTYGDAFTASVAGFSWCALDVTNNDGAAAADIWATAALTP
jgi:hypothetical protein